MNKSKDFELRLAVFQMLRAADVLVADQQERLARADNIIDADVLRTNVSLLRAARARLAMVA